MKESKLTEALLVAFEKGYRIDEKGNAISHKGVLLKTQGIKKEYGHFSVRLVNGQSKKVFIHRLQAYQKYKKAMFADGIVVRHKNGIHTDNSFENILIGTHADNAMDIPKSKRILRASNPKHNHDSIISDHKAGMSYKKIMDKYSISSKGTLSFIINKSLAK